VKEILYVALNVKLQYWILILQLLLIMIFRQYIKDNHGLMNFISIYKLRLMKAIIKMILTY